MARRFRERRGCLYVFAAKDGGPRHVDSSGAIQRAMDQAGLNDRATVAR